MTKVTFEWWEVGEYEQTGREMEAVAAVAAPIAL